MRVRRVFTAFHVCPNDTAADPPIWAGMAGLRHKLRHKPSTAMAVGLLIVRQSKRASQSL
jgi:hypothetical protein